MTLLVVGLGSIGSRRARILAEMGHEIWAHDLDGARAVAVAAAIPGEADTRVTFGPRVPELGKHRVDAAFICTPPESHIELAVQCAEAGITTIFIEKPLYVEKQDLSALDGCRVEVACNMRYDRRIMELAERTATKSDLDVRVCFERPLAKWRPGAEAAYRAHGVGLEAIHELDLAFQILAPVMQAEIDADEDTLWAEIRGLRGRGSVSLRWDDLAEDQREVWCDADGLDNVVDYADPDPDMYRLEMEDFLAGNTPNPLHDAARLTDMVIDAMAASKGKETR